MTELGGFSNGFSADCTGRIEVNTPVLKTIRRKKAKPETGKPREYKALL